MVRWSAPWHHGALERALAKASLPVVKVNPRQARRFAEATGKLAKTDRMDAALLARMGALLQLEARPVRFKLSMNYTPSPQGNDIVNR